jgi:hypothetical protein
MGLCVMGDSNFGFFLRFRPITRAQDRMVGRVQRASKDQSWG